MLLRYTYVNSHKLIVDGATGEARTLTRFSSHMEHGHARRPKFRHWRHVFVGIIAGTGVEPASSEIWIQRFQLSYSGIFHRTRPDENMERILGIEPRSPDWGSGIMSIILYPHGAADGSRTRWGQTGNLSLIRWTNRMTPQEGVEPSKRFCHLLPFEESPTCQFGYWGRFIKTAYKLEWFGTRYGIRTHKSTSTVFAANSWT